MQQAIYTNTHIAKSSVIAGHGTGVRLKFNEGQRQSDRSYEDQPQVQRFRKLRLTMSVLGNVLGGAALLSGMLMLPQLVVILLAS